jgi:PUA-domain protein
MGDISGPRLVKRRTMRRKDVRRLRDEAGALLQDETNSIVQAETEDGLTVFIIDGDIKLARRDDTLFPTLLNESVDELPSVLVDMGAIPYVCNGADVMSPGITDIDGEFNEGDLVIVRDERHRKALAVGLALVKSGDMREMPKGKAVKSIHYVGDKLWKATST